MAKSVWGGNIIPFRQHLYLRIDQVVLRRGHCTPVCAFPLTLLAPYRVAPKLCALLVENARSSRNIYGKQQLST